MFKKILSAALLGAVIAMIWGYVSWMVLPWHVWGTKSFAQDGQAVASALKTEALEPGAYLLPNMPKEMQYNSETEKEWKEKSEKGPVAFITVKPAGKKWDMNSLLGIQFVIQFITALMAAWLLSFTNNTSHIKNGIFVAIAVGAGAFLYNFSNWNWWNFPSIMVLVNLAETLIGWFIAGFAMSFVLKPKRTNV